MAMNLLNPKLDTNFLNFYKKKLRFYCLKPTQTS